MTWSVASRPNADWWSNATGSGRAIGVLWAREVEAIIEDATLENGDLLTFDSGATIANVGQSIEFTDNSETFGFIFGTNTVEFLAGSTGATTIDANSFTIVDVNSLTISTAGFIRIAAHDTAPGATEGTFYADDSTNNLLYYDGTGWVDLTAGAGTPAGADTQMQYNNNGAFGEITTIIWDDTNLEFANDQAAAWGTSGDWLQDFDDSVDDQLLFRTALTASVATTDPMFEIITDTGNANGTGMTADQQIFGVAKGSQASNVSLFTVDEDGDVLVAGALGVTGAITGGSYVGDLTMSSGETLTNTVDSEIRLTENTGSEDLIFDMDAGSNAVGLKSSSGVDELAMGAVDDLTGVRTIVFDADSGAAIALTADAAGEDLSILQSGGVNASLVLVSDGTGADALSIDTSAGGMDLTVAGASGAEDLDLLANTAITLTSTQAAADAIKLNASDAAGGFDWDFGSGNCTLTGTGASADLIIDADLISIDGTGASNITFTNGAAEDVTISTAGAANHTLAITASGTGTDALTLTATAGGMDIGVSGSSADDDLDITSDSSINMTATENNAGAIIIQENGGSSGGINIYANQGTGVAATTEDDASVQLHSDDGGIGLYTTANLANAIRIETNGGGNETIILQSVQGTGAAAAGETDAAIQLYGQVGGIGLYSALNNADAIRLEANGGTSERIAIHANQGSGAASIELLSDIGGIDITAEDTATGDILIDANDDLYLLSTSLAAAGLTIEVDGGTAETLYLHADQGTSASSINIVSDDGGITLNASSGVVFTQGQTRKVLIPVEDVELDGANPPTLAQNGTNAQFVVPSLEFDADGGGTGDDIAYIHWVVPDGYVVDSARLNVYFSHDGAENAADECQFDFTVNAVAAGETLDAAGTGLVDQTTVIADASASNGTLIINQYNIEVEDIAVDDFVTIEVVVDEDQSQMDASGTLDIHYFEIEWESTE
jgi:hypothetical protein